MCTICDVRIELSIEHPLSLSVAVETRKAIDAGLLPQPSFQGERPVGMRSRLDVIDTLRSAQQRLEQVLQQDELLALPDFYVQMVESRTFGFFHPTPSGFDPNCRPSAPNVTAADAAERDVVLVCSELAMREIVVGRLPFKDALQKRLIALDADASRYEKLRSAWCKTYPRVGFSRFVCA